MSKGKKVGYIRVSTSYQNVARQLNGIELDKVFEDTCSGKNTDRPAWTECYNYLRDDDCLYVHSIDRLARNLPDLLKIVDDLMKKGITIHFVTENMIFSPNEENINQKFILQILGAVAEFERQLIKERQREGIAIAREKNAYKNVGRKCKLSEPEIKELLHKKEIGVSVSKLAKDYKISRQTVYVILKDNKDYFKDNKKDIIENKSILSNSNYTMLKNTDTIDILQ